MEDFNKLIEAKECTMETPDLWQFGQKYKFSWNLQLSYEVEAVLWDWALNPIPWKTVSEFS